MLVAKIKEEKELEEKEARNKKEKERDRLAQMMYENEEYRRKVDAQTKEVILFIVKSMFSSFFFPFCFK